MGDALERAAVASGHLASQRELQAYIQEVLGGEIQQQRDAVRAWIARSESTPRHSLLPQAPGSSVSVGTMAVSSGDLTGVTASTNGRRSNVGRLVGLAALAVVGALGFLGYKKLTAPGELQPLASRPRPRSIRPLRCPSPPRPGQRAVECAAATVGSGDHRNPSRRCIDRPARQPNGHPTLRGRAVGQARPRGPRAQTEEKSPGRLDENPYR